ncbi:MAG: ABC transporter permease [Methylophaga sp.]|nr:ABC transporter permease [Methylophaga sp.]
MKSNTFSFLKELYDGRNILSQLVSQQLILRYRRTTLGYLWSLISPLMMMSVMAVVFATLFQKDLKTFAVFLFAGMIPWNFFSSVLTQSGISFINNEGLIKKIYLPKAIFPLSIACALLIDSALAFLALFAIILVLGGSLSWAILFIPVAYVMLFFFSLGLGLIMSITTVFFRDLQYVIAIVMQALFFLTPILYKPSALTGKVAWLIDLNPVVPFIELFRAPLFLGTLPSSNSMMLAALYSVFSMAVGLFVFLRNEKKIVFRL